MRTHRTSMTARAARLLLAGAVLFGAPSTHAELLPPADPLQVPTTLIPSGLHGAWHVIYTPDADAAKAGRYEFEDFLYVDDVSVSSQEVSRLGMDSTGGSATEAAGTITFTASLTSRHHGSVVTNGTAMGGKMSGTLKWTRDGTVYTYNFKGVSYVPVPVES
jgi:hypothetical protein